MGHCCKTFELTQLSPTIFKEVNMTDKCGSCDQIKKENNLLRKSIMETNKNYVEVVNENLELRRELEALRGGVKNG